MASNQTNRPVRHRRIDVNLPSINAVNEASVASTTYFIPGRRRAKRKRSSQSSSSNSPETSTSRSRLPPPYQRSPPAQPDGVHTATSRTSSQDLGVGLNYDDSERTESDSGWEDDMPYDPQSTFDMVTETENNINRAFEEIMATINDEWERANARLRSMMVASLSMIATEATTNRLMLS